VPNHNWRDFLKQGRAYGKLRTSKSEFNDLRVRIPTMHNRLLIILFLSLSICACNKSAGTKENPPPKNAQAAMETRDTDGNTALLRAVNNSDTIEIKRLVEAGADVNAANSSGVTPLMNAGGMGNKEAVELLISKGANVNHRTPGNYTPLMQAALVGQLEIVKILLDAGADPTIKDTGGRTAADYAEEHKHNDIVQLLKERSGTSSKK